MRLSSNGLSLIAGFEGFGGRLYNDPAGHCTIGYGHLVHRGPCDGRATETLFRPRITVAYGRILLRDDVHRFEECINSAVRVALNQNRFDALVSFAFNVGCWAFENSTLLRKLNNGEYHRVCDELRRWNHGGGEVLPGLVRRRKAECELFNRRYDPPVVLPIDEEDDMAIAIVKKWNSNNTLYTNGVRSWHIPDEEVLNQLYALGAPRVVKIPEALFDALWERTRI